MAESAVLTGLDVLAAEACERLRGQRVAVLCHQASVDGRCRHILDILSAAPDVLLGRVFAPEHGLDGLLQDQVTMARAGAAGRREAVPVVNLYGDDFASLWPSLDDLDDIDVLVADLQDVGARYYTFYTTLAFCMERAALAGVRVVVLDRPNPIGGVEVEGPLPKPEMRSFVGYYALPARHGLTLGELALFINDEYKLGADLEIVPMRGWRRDMRFIDTGLPWVMPSPNMPTPETALVYPGGCLLEGTNLSEGRGTTRPFELFGAPFVDGRELARRLDAEGLPGALFRPVAFQPTFHKWAGRRCSGVQAHVTDARLFRPWLTYVLALRHVFEMHKELAWRTEPYEFVTNRLAIDLLLGDPALRQAIESGADRAAFAEWGQPELADYDARRQAYLLYPFPES
ncbi:MAG: DUF1343 domain-containing protein [Myxococcales bacterium]|nr:MAG: DUF1343 domain-containing protein [Myxococcales bacterium]